ncbi:NifB/NifX family molybdenum-iron cluster-binding protein [Thermofilum pendens]|uniref:NifB/NifX family molybdenum-iron cluster-binding protein n=1 Tax=Thermofilum pendens TaxID=2269 RepID=UPI00069A00E8|nr:NifB/NifX family molybdenum-iron cluster-binding protein [Thermofilum pendens]
MRVLVPAVPSGGKYLVSPHFGRAPFFAVVVVEGGSAKLERVERNPVAPTVEEGRGHAVLGFVLSLRPDAVVVKDIGAGAFYRLREAGVEVYAVDRHVEVVEAASMLARGELRRLEAPTESHG